MCKRIVFFYDTDEFDKKSPDYARENLRCTAFDDPYGEFIVERLPMGGVSVYLPSMETIAVVVSDSDRSDKIDPLNSKVAVMVLGVNDLKIHAQTKLSIRQVPEWLNDVAQALVEGKKQGAAGVNDVLTKIARQL